MSRPLSEALALPCVPFRSALLLGIALLLPLGAAASGEVVEGGIDVSEATAAVVIDGIELFRLRGRSPTRPKSAPGTSPAVSSPSPATPPSAPRRSGSSRRRSARD